MGAIADSATLICRESQNLRVRVTKVQIPCCSPNEAEILLVFHEVSSNVASVLNVEEECTAARKFSLAQQTSTEAPGEPAQVWRS